MPEGAEASGYAMTSEEMIHTVQERGEWNTAAKQNHLLDKYRLRKEKRRQKKLRLQASNEALRNMLNRK